MVSMRLNTPSALCLLLSLSFLLSSPSSAHNITKILEDNPQFSTFNDYLTRTTVANQINERAGVTVLALDNGLMETLWGKPVELYRKIIALHVLTSYYDLPMFRSLSKPARFITLLQAMGQATGEQGYLDVTNGKGGVTIESAAGSNTVTVVRPIYSEPNKLSVVQLSFWINPFSWPHSPTPSPSLSHSSPFPSPSSSPILPSISTSPSSSPLPSISTSPSTSSSSPFPSPSNSSSSPSSSPSSFATSPSPSSSNSSSSPSSSPSSFATSPSPSSSNSSSSPTSSPSSFATSTSPSPSTYSSSPSPSPSTSSSSPSPSPSSFSLSPSPSPSPSSPLSLSPEGAAPGKDPSEAPIVNGPSAAPGIGPSPSTGDSPTILAAPGSLDAAGSAPESSGIPAMVPGNGASIMITAILLSTLSLITSMMPDLS